MTVSYLTQGSGNATMDVHNLGHTQEDFTYFYGWLALHLSHRKNIYMILCTHELGGERSTSLVCGPLQVQFNLRKYCVSFELL